MTQLSKEYCNNEFILDTSDFLSCIDEFNQQSKPHKNFLLFSIDVKALYPSIDVKLALEALSLALEKTELENFDDNLKQAIKQMTELTLNNTFVNYQGKSYKCIKGIPTGGATSRQNADIFLHWMLFNSPINLKEKIPLWKFILLWKRYIDDIFGVWIGTKRQFDMFITALNQEAKKFGITFDKYAIGKIIAFLEAKCYLELDGGKIKHRLFKNLQIPGDSFKEIVTILHIHSSQFQHHSW